MKKKIIYWSPCLNPVGTIKSTINSAVSLSKYSKDYEVTIINACGEWDKFVEDLENNSVNVIKLNFSYFKFLPKRAGERYVSALIDKNLSNKIYKYYGKIELKGYIKDFINNV